MVFMLGEQVLQCLGKQSTLHCISPKAVTSMHDETIVTLIHPTKKGDTLKHKNACLVVIYGQDLGRKYNVVEEVGARNFTIGRATSNDICVSQDAVSREHARITWDKDGVCITDNESTNGTYVNDHRIHESHLRDGDLVKIGRSIFKFLSGDNIESAYHEEIFRLSTIDGLTQVFNRRYLMETLERELSRARRYDRPLALLMFDIDHFKRCNDDYGHRAGDYILRRLAELVEQRARKVDVVARYGGEEFTVILPEVDIQGAAIFGEKIRSMLADEKFVFEGKTIPITVSIGASEVDSSIANIDDLIKVADRRLYLAKEGGRNQVICKD